LSHGVRLFVWCRAISIPREEVLIWQEAIWEEVSICWEDTSRIEGGGFVEGAREGL
jgi:hypothetical protein